MRNCIKFLFSFVALQATHGQILDLKDKIFIFAPNGTDNGANFYLFDSDNSPQIQEVNMPYELTQLAVGKMLFVCFFFTFKIFIN